MENKRNLFTFFLVIVCGYIVINIYNQVLGPLVIGALIAYILYPLVIIVKKKIRISHSKSSFFVFIIFIILLLTGVVFSTPVLIKQVKLLENEFDVFSREIIRLQPIIEDDYGINLPLDEMLVTLENELAEYINPNRLFRVIQSATTNLFWVVIIFVSTFFWLKDWDKFKGWFFALFPLRLLGDVKIIHNDIKLIWQSYLRGQLLMMALIGVLSAVGGLIVGLKGAVLMGVLAGGLALIPNIGPAVATIIAGVVAWTQGSTYISMSNIWFAILVCGIYMFIQFLEGVWFQPQIMSKRMRLHPGVIIIVVISTISLLGALAGLIVIPLIGSIGVVFKYNNSKREDLRVVD